MKLSAGLLLYRIADGAIEVLIVHPGGPFWARKDNGAWSIPKGEYTDGEDPRTVAYREFEEEIGSAPPTGEALELGRIKQPSGKVVTVFSVEGDLDLAGFTSNTFEMEWPRNSGKTRAFPEIDRAEWMPIAEARIKLLKGQVPFLDLLVEQVTQ